PNANVTGVTSGSRGMINALLNLDPVSGQPIPGTPAHSIGYVAPEYALQFGAPLTAIQNRASPPTFVSPTTGGAVTAALQSGATFDAASRLYTIDSSKITATGAYPIPLVSYLEVSTTGLTSAKATALAGFIRFALGTAGQADVASTGMVGLPPDVIAAGLRVADGLKPTTGSTATTTTTGSTTVTTASGAPAAPDTSDPSAPPATPLTPGAPSTPPAASTSGDPGSDAGGSAASPAATGQSVSDDPALSPA